MTLDSRRSDNPQRFRTVKPDMVEGKVMNDEEIVGEKRATIGHNDRV